MAVATKMQVHMEDKFIEDDGLLQLLHEREEAKLAAASARGEFRDLDDRARGLIGQKEINGTVRCGPFLIIVSEEDPKDVSFTRKGGTRVRIKSPKTEG